MFRTTKIYAGVLVALGGTLSVATSPVFGQQELDRVEITGSRIRSLGAESPSPLQVITAEDIARSGATNVQDILLKNPVFGAPTYSRTNSNFLTSSAGVSTIDLRNLGISRTLVLVNGRRFVSGIPGETAVDLNTIPTDFIERIELLTGGSSSTYGSDAVAGVVNIILKRDFNGFIFDGSGGISAKNDDKKAKVGLTFGTTGADGKANMMGHIGYSKQGVVSSSNRDFSAVDQASLGAVFTGDPNDFFTAQRPFYSSFAPQGRFFYTNPVAGQPDLSYTYDRNGAIIPFSTNGPAGDGVGATGFNRSDYRSIAVPTERFLFAGKGDYAITENHRIFFEGTYAASKTTSRIEPFPLGAESIYPATGGRVPAEFLVNGVVTRNPIVPQYLYDRLTDRDGDNLKDYYFTRRLSEVGTRGNIADRDTFRIATGLKGSITPTWDYDSYLIFGVTKESQTSSGQVNVLNFRNALEAIPDVSDLNGNGSTTDAICRDATARAQGCVPIDIFGYNSISPAALNYVTAPGMLSTFTRQKIAGGSISGEPFSLPAGPVGIAGGIELRKEYSRSEFDPLQQAGLNAGNAIPRTEGSFDVKEAFIETRVPLMKNAPFVKALGITSAVRVGKYSTVGNTLSWNAGAEWAPTGDFKFRATKALSTRAPNINELYQPPSQTFPADLNDPCSGVTAATPGATAAACRNDPGIAANIAANGAYVPNQADIQGISGFDRGNPKLQEEKGHSLTLGLVFAPKSIPALSNFSFTMDYFDIKIDDAIVSTPRQFILDQCYGGDTSFCQFVTRRQANVGANSAGSIQYIDSASTNSGDYVTKGVDFTVSHAGNVAGGRLNTHFAWTYLLKGYLTPLPGSARDEFIGEVGSPRNKGSLTLGYNWGPWSVTSQTTYIGKSSLDDTFLSGYGLTPDSIKVKAKTYNDFQFGYTMGKVQYYLGIDNAFNVQPAPILTGITGNDTGTETNAGTYDPIGRRYYVGLRFSL